MNFRLAQHPLESCRQHYTVDTGGLTGIKPTQNAEEKKGCGHLLPVTAYSTATWPFIL